MSNFEVIEKKPISLAELREEISIAQKRDGELGFRGGKVQEFINNLNPLNSDKALELTKKIEELEIPRLKEDHIVKIVDFLPTSISELDVLLQGYPITVTKESQEKIVSVVKEFAS